MKEHTRIIPVTNGFWPIQGCPQDQPYTKAVCCQRGEGGYGDLALPIIMQAWSDAPPLSNPVMISVQT